MSGRGETIGWLVLLEIAPAALFGCAVAFAAAGAGTPALASAVPLILGLAGGCGALLVLRRFSGSRQAFPLPQFEQLALEPVEPGDLAGDCGELLLDDILAPADPGSRVVRLFDRQPFRSSGEIHAYPTGHSRSAVRPIPTPPDATEALHEALASLRQSLR